jgi:3-oxoacyl-[acyl-carrier-protein] synthase-3
LIGVIALGMYAPPEIRTNDWWPNEVITRWRADRRTQKRPTHPEPLTDGMRRVLDAAAELADDPFQGVVERRVLASTMTIGDMEELAANDALERAHISRAEIGLLLTHTVVPEHQLVNPACELHARLQLSRECLSVEVEATAYSVFAQLALAEAMIAAGRTKYALLVQSCAGSRLVDQSSPLSVVGGDAATAIVLGPVTADRGIRAMTHFTDGRYSRSLVLTVDGTKQLIANPVELWAAQIQTADVCRDSAELALHRAGYSVADVDYLCAFQGTAWLERAIATHMGATHARTSEVFRRFGYLSAAGVTAALYIGEHDGRLVGDDLVVMTGGGTGMTYGAAVLRWGK